MSEHSLIEWTDATWNPLLGCDRISAGCTNCYAIRTAWRLSHNPNPKVAAAYEGLVKQRADGSLNWTGRINLLEERLREPLAWSKPRRVFVNSQSDLFHEDVPDAFVMSVFAVMAAAGRHTFQVLTKRADRMRAFVTRLGKSIAPLEEAARALGYSFQFEGIPLLRWPLSNVWLGVSVEDQGAADERIPDLLGTAAAVRFLSCEPMLKPVNLHRLLLAWPSGMKPIHWIICGGESGPGARPMHPEWVRGMRDQCYAAQIPFFFKQWGEWLAMSLYNDPMSVPDEDIRIVTMAGELCENSIPAGEDGFEFIFRAGKKKAGRLLDGREWNEMPLP